jgi:cytochrome c oxidase cbb3-type subunit I
MNPALTSTESKAQVTHRDIDQVDRALIDASARGPVLTCFTTATFWLLVASLFGFISSLKLHAPEFLGDISWLTYGRTWPAYMNALVYGWATLSGFGTAIWLLARLCRVSLRKPWTLNFGILFWNFGVLLGIGAVLSGNNEGYEFLEFPGAVAAVLFVAYLLIGAWGYSIFRNRRPEPAYISTWYIVAGLLWFPWAFGAAYLMLNVFEVQGVMQAVTGSWYAQSLLGLWLTSVGLAAVYYLIPKVLGKPIYSYNLAAIGFWTFALFYNLTAMVRYNGGPIPVWLVTLSIVANILMLIPIATVTVNYLFTMRGYYNMVYYSPTIRFTFFGAIAYTVAGVLGAVISLRSVDSVTHFTHVIAGQTHLVIYAFFTMVMFGAIYYIVPRLVGCEWFSASLVRLHFWATAYGIGMTVVLLLIGGSVQGATMNDPNIAFTDVIESMLPYLRGRTIAWVFLTVGHLVFAFHFLLMLLRLGQPGGTPTLFAVEGEEEGGH